MPGKNVVKKYVEGGVYHLYNRGVEKRDIFLDDQDYRVFLAYLRLYLSPTMPTPSPDLEKSHKDLSSEVDLVTYCLMPNHYHLLVQQHTLSGITSLIRCVTTNYSMYFNRRYNRVGSLFGGNYRAVLIQTDEHIMHVSRYIHLNPEGINQQFAAYQYSSYGIYTQQSHPAWVKPELVSQLFKPGGYEQFVLDKSLDSEATLGPIALDGQ